MTPKFKRNIYRILPFGIIWLVISWVNLFHDLTISRNQNLNPDTDITLTLPIFIFANVAIFLVGLMVGTIEMVILEKRFKRYSLLKKITYKFLFYSFLMLVTISITYPIAASIESDLPISSVTIWEKTGRYFLSLTFVNTMVQLGFSLFLSLIYAVISENLGHNVLRNLFIGKYHTPKIEKRIFMFLDMNDSTTIAEELGHVKYFKLLEKYYQLMSDPIINHLGEVYQYIGDEIVVSWKVEDGIKENNCIKCFEAIKRSMVKQHEKFSREFGFQPYFKAGMHLGEVTTGEIGALKREIVFTGDVLNATARIQALCKTLQEELLISEELLHKLDQDTLQTIAVGEHQLKGKHQLVKLYAIGIDSK